MHENIMFIPITPGNEPVDIADRLSADRFAAERGRRGGQKELLSHRSLGRLFVYKVLILAKIDDHVDLMVPELIEGRIDGGVVDELDVGLLEERDALRGLR